MYLKFKNGFYVNYKHEDNGYKFNSIKDLIFYVQMSYFTRFVPKSEFDKMTQKTFINNTLFFCDNCNIRMNPISIEADF